jgi:hypothetical protein
MVCLCFVAKIRVKRLSTGRLLVVLIAGIALLGLSLPAVSLANHVSITANLTARLKERVSSRSWLVEVSWDVTCVGVGAGGASYQGNLYLIDLKTGENMYLGGVSSASGTVNQLVEARSHERNLVAELRISCYDNDSLHGSGNLVVRSDVSLGSPGPLIIPGRSDDGEGGPGGGGGGRSAGGDPTAPLRNGGCSQALQGTNQADDLTGSPAGDVIFGYGGGDRLRGQSGHDCLLGGRGNDRLFGEAGDDRLTGGTGRDVLVGGPGVNAYDAGSGNDSVNAVNRRRELVRCGRGRDSARVDRRDRVIGCEQVRRVG